MSCHYFWNFISFVTPCAALKPPTTNNLFCIEYNEVHKKAMREHQFCL